MKNTSSKVARLRENEDLKVFLLWYDYRKVA